MGRKALSDSMSVVVTGIGAVTAAGWGVASLRAALRSGQTAIGPFDRLEHSTQRTHIAGQVPPRPAFPGGRSIRWDRLSNSDAFALFATHEAAQQAGILQDCLGVRGGVFFGSTTGGLFETEKYFEAIVRWPGKRPSASPLASHMCSASADMIARYLGVAGPVETISSACASGGLAIEQALRALREEEVEVAVVGAADCLCLTTYSGFNSLRAVDPSPCRPFRRDRAGLSLGEGGAVLILETARRALARGARPLARLLGAGSSCDASHMTAPHREGRGAAAAIRSALDDAGLEPATIDLVSAHGTGTLLNDTAEWAALRAVFGERSASLPVAAIKGVIGHLLGAAGVVQAVSTILALVDSEVHPVPGRGTLDPAAPACVTFDRPQPVPNLRNALSISLGFGGANAAFILGRSEPA